MQNIDLMNLAGFCRNCLSKWSEDGGRGEGERCHPDEARESVYGMPYDEWKAKHQREASTDQKSAFEQGPQALTAPLSFRGYGFRARRLWAVPRNDRTALSSCHRSLSDDVSCALLWMSRARGLT